VGGAATVNIPKRFIVNPTDDTNISNNVSDPDFTGRATEVHANCGTWRRSLSRWRTVLPGPPIVVTA
jgi:hypothetical protein